MKRNRIKALRNALRRGRLVQIMRCAQSLALLLPIEGLPMLAQADAFRRRCQAEKRLIGSQIHLMKPRPPVRGSNRTPRGTKAPQPRREATP